MPKTFRPSAEHGRLISKLDSIGRLNADDRVAVAGLPLRTRTVDAGDDLVLEGSSPTECLVVLDGLLARYNLVRDGERQIHSFHIPGDLPDRDTLHVGVMDHSICALSSARVAFIPHEAITALLNARPNIAVALWRDSIIDGGIYRQWLTGVGRRSAKQRVAHLICETFVRMGAVGLAENDHFYFPVTQSQLGDALGLTAVHVNRTLQELRQAGLITWKGTVVSVPDVEALQHAGDFDRTYLHLRTSTASH